MIQQQWDVNDHFTISNYRSAKTLQGVNNKSINLHIYNDVHSLPLPVGLDPLCRTMSVGTPPPLFRHDHRTATTIGMRIDLGIVRTFPTVGGGWSLGVNM